MTQGDARAAAGQDAAALRLERCAWWGPGRRWLRGNVGNLDWLSAQVSACEVIMRHDGGPEGKPTGESAGAQPLLRRVELSRLLLIRMRQEPLFAPYLEKANGDPLLALTLAKSDVTQLEKLRSLGWSPWPEVFRNIGKVLILPVTIIAITALFGSCVGTYLQEASARRNRTFDLRLTTLKNGLSEASAWQLKVRDIYKQIGSDEDQNVEEAKALESNLQRDLTDADRAEFRSRLDRISSHSWASDADELRKLERELTKLEYDSMSADDGRFIASKAQAAREALGNFLTCLEREKWDWNVPCAKAPGASEPNLTPYLDFVASYSTAIKSLPEE